MTRAAIRRYRTIGDSRIFNAREGNRTHLGRSWLVVGRYHGLGGYEGLSVMVNNVEPSTRAATLRLERRPR
jgi:hypothetical protein